MRKTLITLAFSILAAVIIAPAVASAQNIIEFDVAEDGTRFVFQNEPLLANGFPAYGNPFVTTGYLYAKNRLTVDASGTVNGVNANGTPQFPNDVKGLWHCRGWFIGDGANTVTGPWTISHQLYQITTGSLQGEISTDGVELVDIGVQGERAIIGGTDDFEKARGEQFQTLLGFNVTGGVGLRILIRVFRT
jgi:hypothetical protein